MDEPARNIDSIFVEALNQPTAAERNAFLQRVCGDNVTVRRRVERLLEAHDRSEDFLELPAPMLGSKSEGGSPPAADTMGFLGHDLGDFRLVREIGAGGMGVVYEAEQMSLHRRVALKILPFAGVLDPKHLQRFKNEAVAAASLKHPNIVGVHAVGCERGVHYFAMEYVEGRTLAEVIAMLRQNAAWAARRPVNSLTPSGTPWNANADVSTADDNLLVSHSPSEAAGSQDPTSCDPLLAASCQHRGRITAATHSLPMGDEFFGMVAKWGIQAAEGLEHAHQTGIVHRDIKPSNLIVDGRGHLWITDFGLAQFETDATVTMTGDVLGTLRYMSPEQALGNRQVLDHRTDIYSLGVTLYELLTLEYPYESEARQALVNEIVDGAVRPLRQRNRAIPRDLETIVLKAMAADVPARYASARELAEDLKRFLAHEPIHAYPPSLVDRLTKWARRHRTVVWSAAATLLIAVLGLSVSIVIATGAYREERRQHELANQRGNELRQYLYAADLKLAHQAWKHADLAKARDFLARHRPESGEEDARGFEWHYLWTLCQHQQTTLTGHDGDIYYLTFSPDGATLASASQDGTVKLWDTATRHVRSTLRVQASDVNHVAFSPDAAHLAATGDGGVVKLFAVSTGEEKVTLEGHADDVFGVAFSQDGRWLATAGADDTVRLWNGSTLREEAVLHGHTGDVQSIALSPDGKTIASVSSDATLRLWDVATRSQRASADGHAKLCSVTYSRDGTLIATSSIDRTVRLWRAADLEELRCLQGHSGTVHGLSISPQGRQLASSSGDGSVRVWDTVTGELLNVLRGHTGRVWSVQFSPDGQTLATAGADRTIKLWNAAARQDCRPGPTFSGMVHRLKFAPDGTLLIVSNTEVAAWDLHASVSQFQAKWNAEPTSSSDFSPNGRTVALGNMGGGIRLWNAATGELQLDLGRHGDGADVFPIQSVVLSADGQTLVSYCRKDGALKVWDVATQRERCSVHLAEDAFSLTLAPNGRTLAIGFRQGRTKLLDAADGREQTTLVGEDDDEMLCLAYSPDGKMLATGGGNRVIRLWDTATGRQLHTLVGHGDWIQSLAFTPDGRTLASASRDGTLRFWNPVLGHERLVLETPIAIQHLAFSADGHHLAGAGTPEGQGGEVFVWSGAADEPPPQASGPAAASGRHEPNTLESKE